MSSPLDATNSILGLRTDPQNLTFLQISLRGVIVFVAALIMVRLGDARFLSKKSAFDAILGFVLASMLARAVNGTVSFFPTLGGGFGFGGPASCNGTYRARLALVWQTGQRPV